MASHIFYHVIGPHGGSQSELIASIKEHLSNYLEATKKILVFDKYRAISSKDHERMRRASEVVIDYELSIASYLPKRDMIMKSKFNKQKHGSV